jgi:RNA polymerase sigma factor (sigma-70 family)
MNPETTVFVVDDDPAVIEVLDDLVELIGLKAQSYRSAGDFLKGYQRTGPACLVLDVRMPGMSGLELQKQLLADGDTIPIIIITGHADIRMAVDAMKAGACEFLEKPFRAQELCDSIQKAVRMDQDAWERRRQREDAERRIEQLTAAEREVMEMVFAGKTNRMIAEELGLSLRAVEDRRARMMKKLGIESRAELVELVSGVHLLGVDTTLSVGSSSRVHAVAGEHAI